MKLINDSTLSPQQALRQNPESVCPKEIINSLGLMTVEYLGFDECMHTGQIVIAQALEAEVETFFRHALEQKFPIEKVIPAAGKVYGWDDEKLMADNVSSGFNYRQVAGCQDISMHGLGRAFDINPLQNPYIRFENGKKIVQPPGAAWNPAKPGTLTGDHPLVKLMEGMGWEWGGRWTPSSGRVDYQHFEKSSSSV